MLRCDVTGLRMQPWRDANPELRRSHDLSLHLSSAKDNMEGKGERILAQQQQQDDTHQGKQAERKGHCVTCHQHTPKRAGESGEGQGVCRGG